ncbi:hypothetical protein C5748_23145 [Phyllobacterium phragmitis]|uniref:Uncharacterized protein n=2 Tax=Phyllobacterium phragmitis TaxID=2670329 RepID=A0A2S9IKU1_9HYPH|nr:hypothetical protein C5748_23145 [Phyllobacterium phragmitis]
MESIGGNAMRPNASTKMVLITSVVLAVFSLLPVFGVLTGVLGIDSYWLMSMAFFVLVTGNLLNGV